MKTLRASLLLLLISLAPVVAKILTDATGKLFWVATGVYLALGVAALVVMRAASSVTGVKASFRSMFSETVPVIILGSWVAGIVLAALAFNDDGVPATIDLFGVAAYLTALLVAAAVYDDARALSSKVVTPTPSPQPTTIQVPGPGGTVQVTTERGQVRITRTKRRTVIRTRG